MATNIVVPELGESIVEARIAKWIKQEGDLVATGDALVELETEKVDVEVSADRAGVLTSIRHGAGADVKVGEVLAILEPPPAGAAGPTTIAAAAPSAPAAPSAQGPPQAIRDGARVREVYLGSSLAKSGVAAPGVTS